MGFLVEVCQGRTATKPLGLPLAVGLLVGSWEEENVKR